MFLRKKLHASGDNLRFFKGLFPDFGNNLDAIPPLKAAQLNVLIKRNSPHYLRLLFVEIFSIDFEFPLCCFS